MNTEVANKKVSRRRRRPPRSADRRPPEREAEGSDERPTERASERRPASASAGASASAPAGRREQGPPAPVRHRGEARRRPLRPGSDAAAAASDPLPELPRNNRGPADPPVSPLNPNIFIYTYTLRPRSLLENYQPGPTRTERMEFENTATL